MTRLKLLLCLLLLSTSFALAQERYLNEEHGFSVSIPAGWKEIPSTDQDEIAAWRRPDAEAEASVISVDAGEATLADFLEAIREDLDPAQVLGQREVSLGGQPAYQLVVKEDADDGAVAIHTILIAHGRAYDMLVFGLASEYAKDPEPFHRIGASFLLEEGD